VSAESDLKRYRDEANRLRTQIGRASATVVAKRRKATRARTAAGKSKVDSTTRSKLGEADSAERDANAAEKKRSDLEKKLADAEKKIATAQSRHEKDQQAKQKKSLDAIRRENAAAAPQFAPTRRLGEPPSGLVTNPGRLDNAGEAAPPDLAPDWDVFLSHASEDKDEMARPLKDALAARGLSVWFDEIKIKVGQSIRQESEKGITHARFGVVVLSPDFFAKHGLRRSWMRSSAKRWRQVKPHPPDLAPGNEGPGERPIIAACRHSRPQLVADDD
jgi:hypothetical protein